MLDISFQIICIILLVIIIICTTGIILSVYIAKKTGRTPFKLINRILMGIYLASITCGCILLLSYAVATNHGLYTTDITLTQLYTGIGKAPVEDKLPDNISGCIIIFYKFGCKDCETIYQELSDYVDSRDNIYWVSSRSSQGKALLANYPIESIPTAIYIHENSDGNAYTKKTLYQKDRDGNTIFDTNAMDRLLYLQAQNR